MTTPLIPVDNTFALGAILFGLAWFGFWIDNHPIGKKTSGVVWILVAAMLLSNFGAIPLESPAYGFAFGTLVPLAIPLLLLKADLKKIFAESGPVMITFAIAAAATMIGAVLGFYLLSLGEIGPKVAGVYTGGWVGGAVNFLAVSQAVEMTPEEFTSAISASSVVSILALMTLVALPTMKFITRLVPLRTDDTLTDADKAAMGEANAPRIRLSHISAILALGLAIVAIGNHIGTLFGTDQYNILFVTIITLIVANVFPKQLSALEGDFEIGMLCMYVFFAAIGASTNATAFLGSAVILFFYGCVIIIVHLLIVLAAAKLLKIDLAEAVVASGAALVGPAATAAIATSRGWRHLVTPAIMCGIFGYAIATFLGVAVTRLLA